MKSTIEKGDKLENFAYEKFRQFILSNELPYVNQKCASLYKKKEYYSRDRGSNIVVDLSIELNFPGATKAASLCIIECKNYSSRVPVCDVEEFCSKIDQIAGKNVKGILVITSTLQEAAFKYAESKNIGVLRVKINEGVEWLLYRKSRSYEDISNDNNLYKKSFIDPDVPTPAGIIGCNHGVCYLDVNKFIVSAFIDLGFSFQKNKDQHNEMINEFSVPYLLNEEIETKAYSIIENMRKSYGQVAIMTPIEYYVKYLKDVYGCELFFNLFLGYNEKEQEILGSISFFEKKIFISSSLKENNSRLRFTLAHEMGHIILHTDIYKKIYASYDDSIQVIENYELNGNDLNRLEYQANMFASYLLLPKQAFINSVSEIVADLNIRDRGYGLIYVDDQSCNINSYYAITSKLMLVFGTSRLATEFRLKQLGLLTDNRKNGLTNGVADARMILNTTGSRSERS